jgi:hypothetical protein
MNIIQRILGVIFPPYKFSVIRKEQGKLLNAIINALPEEFAECKEQLAWATLMGLSNWVLFPEYRFTAMAYAGESLFRLKKRGKNYNISGLRIFSKKTNKWEQIDLLVQDNLMRGLRITNSNYDLLEFDLNKISNSNVIKNDVEFPPDDIEIFYGKLPQEIKTRLDPDRLSEIDFVNRTYYTFHDLEDGNYLAVDKKLNVYSLVHDARPMAKKMKVTFKSILDDLANGSFQIEKHLNERYSEKD